MDGISDPARLEAILFWSKDCNMQKGCQYVFGREKRRIRPFEGNSPKLFRFSFNRKERITYEYLLPGYLSKVFLNLGNESRHREE
jgi:hypothetical protein